MRPFVVVVVLLATFALVLTCEAEVVELKNGQRVEGAVKSVTTAAVNISIAGQPVSFPRDSVSAIYFGTPPRNAANANPLNDVLRVLKGL